MHTGPGEFPGIFFFALFSFFNKIQNPMAHARAQTASLICFMFGLKERPYPGRELKSFGVILIIKTLLFLRFWILAIIKIW